MINSSSRLSNAKRLSFFRNCCQATTWSVLLLHGLCYYYMLHATTWSVWRALLLHGLCEGHCYMVCVKGIATTWSVWRALLFLTDLRFRLFKKPSFIRFEKLLKNPLCSLHLSYFDGIIGATWHLAVQEFDSWLRQYLHFSAELDEIMDLINILVRSPDFGPQLLFQNRPAILSSNDVTWQRVSIDISQIRLPGLLMSAYRQVSLKYR